MDTLFQYKICIVDMYLFKNQDKQVPVLMTGPPKPHFDTCTTSQDSGLVRNSAQNQFGVEWEVLFWLKTEHFYRF